MNDPNLIALTLITVCLTVIAILLYWVSGRLGDGRGDRVRWLAWLAVQAAEQLYTDHNERFDYALSLLIAELPNERVDLLRGIIEAMVYRLNMEQRSVNAIERDSIADYANAYETRDRLH